MTSISDDSKVAIRTDHMKHRDSGVDFSINLLKLPWMYHYSFKYISKWCSVVKRLIPVYWIPFNVSKTSIIVLNILHEFLNKLLLTFDNLVVCLLIKSGSKNINFINQKLFIAIQRQCECITRNIFSKCSNRDFFPVSFSQHVVNKFSIEIIIMK